MFKVYDVESARNAYKAIKMFTEFGKESIVKNLIDDIKRDLRKWSHKSYNVVSFFDGDIERRIVKDYGIDGFLELVMLPDSINSEENAKEFFHEHMYIEPINSMYDCTGRVFTGWYKLFNRNGRFISYHRVCMDV